MSRIGRPTAPSGWRSRSNVDWDKSPLPARTGGDAVLAVAAQHHQRQPLLEVGQHAQVARVRRTGDASRPPLSRASQTRATGRSAPSPL